MPKSNTKGDDDPPKKNRKKIALKEPKKPRKKRAPRKAGQSSGKRGELDLKSKQLGETVRKRIKLDEPLPDFEATEGIRKTGLDSLRSGDKLKAAKQFNDSFRRLGPNMDEFFSTATMREFAKGLIGETSWSDLSKREQAYVNGLIDLLSAIRAPTKFVGFTLDKEKLQHPTSREDAPFEDPYLTASKHAELDQKRRNYVQAAGEKAITEGENARGIVVAAAKAAIEFTLNSMAAPISASNVQPYSNWSSLEATDPKVLEQVRWREYLKNFYEKVLGGKLRPADPKETKKASLKRRWEPQSDATLFAPPSPRRYDDDEEEELEDKGQSDKIELDDLLAPQPQSLASDLDQSGQTIFGQDVSKPSTAFKFDPPSDEYGTFSTTTNSSDYGTDYSFGATTYRDDDIELSDLSGFPYSAPTSSYSFNPSDYSSQFSYQSDTQSLFAPSSPSQQFSYASDDPGPVSPSNQFQSFNQDEPFQFGGFSQSQVGESQFGQGQFGSQFGQSSTSLTADNPFSSSLSGEALGEAFVDETLIDLVLL